MQSILLMLQRSGGWTSETLVLSAFSICFSSPTLWHNFPNHSLKRKLTKTAGKVYLHHSYGVYFNLFFLGGGVLVLPENPPRTKNAIKTPIRGFQPAAPGELDPWPWTHLSTKKY